MATHKVTYETITKPDPKTLPTGAKVEQISRFPAVVTAHRRTLRVNRVQGGDGNAATVKITTDDGTAKGLPLTEDQAREIGETLVKAADESAAERTKREKAAKTRKLADERMAAARRADRLLGNLGSLGYRDPFRF
ncbi:hypothetical protein ATK36_3175 [Amycolatopsis sulphurea]|uniref:Uncharacterized protein n=1 Tax=Amycolatopsis sulphurea TaxID=76022 RepID=A0A2A9FBF0_9PSEU|nr:hypothetical protein [Amycolatopsis sulphurea]PFG48101.1 hypothetical protein ATK36_3175 [Amycolatopsis sulphurea]